jgi:hypothetical protein
MAPHVSMGQEGKHSPWAVLSIYLNNLAFKLLELKSCRYYVLELNTKKSLIGIVTPY